MTLVSLWPRETGSGAGHVKFYPYEKVEKVVAMLKGGGGGTTCFGVDFTW